MSADARRRVAEAQRALLAALLDGAPPPPGFDAERLRLGARALHAKRERQQGNKSTTKR